MSEKADDEGGLSPTEEENAFWRNLDRRGLKVFIKKQYYSSTPRNFFARMPTTKDSTATLTLIRAISAKRRLKG